MIFFELLNNPGLVIVWLTSLVLALSFHEFAHAYSAYRLGDDTAEKAGRLTLNPLAHLDPVGSIMLLLVGFGWAKPVPVNPYLLQKGRLGKFAVSAAGIFANIFFVFVSILALKFILAAGVLDESNYLVKFLTFLVYINTALAVFNLFPIPPLDGYRILESLTPRSFSGYAYFIERWGFIIIIAIVFLTNIVGIAIFYALRLLSAISGVNLFF